MKRYSRSQTRHVAATILIRDRWLSDDVPDIAAPFGFDLATVFAGSGFTLLFSAGIAKYGSQFQYTPATLYGVAGAALVVLGVLYGLLLVALGHR